MGLKDYQAKKCFSIKTWFIKIRTLSSIMHEFKSKMFTYVHLEKSFNWITPTSEPSFCWNIVVCRK